MLFLRSISISIIIDDFEHVLICQYIVLFVEACVEIFLSIRIFVFLVLNSESSLCILDRSPKLDGLQVFSHRLFFVCSLSYKNILLAL